MVRCDTISAMNRKIYDDLVVWSKSARRKPLLLNGTRQVGKTYLLKEFGKREFQQFHYINFQDNPEKNRYLFKDGLKPAEVIKNFEIINDITVNIKTDLLILDEIQECPEAITSLKYFQEDLSELAVCCAGSHLGIAVSEAPFPVGKVDFLQMFPMTFEEFLMAVKPSLAEIFSSVKYIPGETKNMTALVLHDALWEELKKYYIVGGLPEAVAMYREQKNLPDGLREARKVQTKLLQAYSADFSKHSGKENANHLDRVFNNIPLQMWGVTDSSIPKYKFKNVIPGKTKYSELESAIDWLNKAGLILKTYILETPEIPLRVYAKENTFKLYLFDTGLLCCMADIPFAAVLEQNYGTFKGFFAENFVAQELKASGVNQLFSWHGRNSKIEFLLQNENNILPVEVKSGSRTNAKSLSVYIEKYQPQRCVKFSARPYHPGERVDTVPLMFCAKVADGI